MFNDPGVITTIIIIAFIAIIPGWLIRIWLTRIELRQIMDRMTAQGKREDQK